MVKIESLENCKKCPQFAGMYDVSTIKCNRHSTTVVVICQPSSHNKGFKNGVMIVRCGHGK